VLVAADDTSFCERLAHATTVSATPGNCALLLEHVRDERKIPTILCDRTAFGGTTWARLIACSDELWALQSYPAASGVVSVNRLRQAHDARFPGPPLANTRFRVLDPNLTATPIDACGELCIGGNLSTACSPANAESERWIYVPGGSGGDELLFRTGDAARIRPDGRVEIAGRQAGFEVPAPQAPSPLSKDSIDPQLEGQLQQIWAELLGLQVGSIDVHANFFELGGHSLLAARMLTRVEAQCGRRVALAALFRAPSIRGLARLLRADAREFDFRQVVKLQADGANTPLIAINNTGIFYVLAKRLGPQQPVTSLQIFDPATQRSGLPQTLEEVAAEYVGLIRRTQPHGPYVLAGWCIAGALAFEIGRQLHAAGAQVRQLILIDSWVPGYFSRLPLPHRLIGRFSLRWQLARNDWKRFRSGQHTWPQFIERRVTLRAVWRLWQSLTRHSPGGSGEAAATAQELHDKWLLDYLQSLTDRYVPGSYSGHITLLRSTREPTGWLFDPLAGWGRFARARGVTLEMIEGDHFTMFQDPGASQMASRLVPLIGTP
jgi:thioesterase domain-containing protein